MLVGGHLFLGERDDGAKDRRAAACLRRAGADLLRQAQPAGARRVDRRPDEPRRRAGLGRHQRRHQGNQACPRRRGKAAALPACRRCRRCTAGLALRRAGDPRRQRGGDLGDDLPGRLCRRDHLRALVLAAAALSGLGPRQLHLPDAGLRRALCRSDPWRTARSHYLHCAGADRGRACPRQPCAPARPVEQ